ncbi:MAG: endolytic transglycosylase MltG [Tissierellia bacterium]|nr:hypothetical protein [Bacillota bacterium]NLL22885.1 endolytic transglycosylase MltG [Tissierellia bacterium]
MFEKIKDVWYDVSDFLITFIIIVLIVGSIAFIMTNTLGVDFALSDYLTFLRDQPAPSVSVTEPKPEPTLPVIIQTPIVPIQTQTEATPAESPSEEPVETNTGPEVQITVNTGDYLRDVANELLRKNVILSVRDFMDRVVEKGLEGRLQVGTFTFHENMTYDEVIGILFP